MDIRNQIINRIAGAAGVVASKIALEHPELLQHGDYSTNIALILKGGRVKAEEIAAAINTDDLIEQVIVAGPGFVNISIQTTALISVLSQVLKEGENYGKSKIGEGKKIVIDYSAPNIAKPFGIGHLRSTIIGQALYNLYHSLGYETIGDNHLGDWGTQFGKLLYMIDVEKPENLDIEKLEELYVKFHKMAVNDISLEDKARSWFKKLEDGDEVARSLWRKCWDVSMAEFNRIYEILGVRIDETLGESFYEDKMAEVVSEAKQKGVAKISEGAWVIDIPGTETPLMLIKSDGASTYATRDLATIKYRMDRWKPEKIVYEVGGEQSLHFVQVFSAARLMEYVTDGVELIHTKHGLYLDSDGKKFSTRKGKTVKLEGVLLEAVERAKKLGSEVGDETAKKVGIGAIKYFDLKHGVSSDIVFDWEKMFELAGNSGPYLQYTYARTKSIARKFQETNSKISSLREQTNSSDQTSEYKPNDEELAILRWIYRFPEVIEESAKRLAPNLMCNFLFELAARFNTFYNKHSILSAASDEEKKFRLTLTAAVGQVLANGLNLLGIEAPEKM